MSSTSAHEPGITISGERYGEGDTYLILDALPPELEAGAFERLREEVQWSTMSHRGGEVPRLVAVEGDIAADGSFPIYRHPADASPPLLPFSPTAARIRAHVSQLLGQPLNHALIQLYRHGGDYISEHSDKTVDVVHGSSIVNVSLGAQRTMTLRTKRDAVPSASPAARTKHSVPLPHNSAFVLGAHTNRAWLHSVRADRRPAAARAPAERAYGGERISLTFRNIGTFLCADASSDSGENASPDTDTVVNAIISANASDTHMRIWGQGATSKSRADARPVVRGGPTAEALLHAFGAENQRSDFEWEEVYGRGFDVLHFS